MHIFEYALNGGDGEYLPGPQPIHADSTKRKGV